MCLNLSICFSCNYLGWFELSNIDKCVSIYLISSFAALLSSFFILFSDFMLYLTMYFIQVFRKKFWFFTTYRSWVTSDPMFLKGKIRKKYIALRFLKFLFKSRLQTVYSSYKRLSYSLLTYYIKYEHFFKNIDKVVLGTIHKKPECKPNFVDYSSQIIKTHIFIVLTHS